MSNLSYTLLEHDRRYARRPLVVVVLTIDLSVGPGLAVRESVVYFRSSSNFILDLPGEEQINGQS